MTPRPTLADPLAQIIEKQLQPQELVGAHDPRRR